MRIKASIISLAFSTLIMTSGPTSASWPVWACAGQSNAVELCGGGYLSAYATVYGSWAGGREIEAWAPNGDLWPGLNAAASTRPTAFVWWQGESGALTGNYLAQLRDVVTRTRAAASNPVLPVFVVELGFNYFGSSAYNDLQTFCATDGHAFWVQTSDLAWDPDGVHMWTHPESYAAVAARIANLISSLPPERVGGPINYQGSGGR